MSQEMEISTVRRSILVAAILALITTQVRAENVVLPTGLAPGSQYEIVFVTADGSTATSSNIADYNSSSQPKRTRTQYLRASVYRGGPSHRPIRSTPT